MIRNRCSTIRQGFQPVFTGGGGSSGLDPLVVPEGLLGWTSNPSGGGSSTLNTNLNQPIWYGTAIWLPTGTTITNIIFHIETAASGTTPTGFYSTICTASKIVGQSNNLNASAALTSTGLQLFPLNATYTTNAIDSANGLYYIGFLQAGAFGTTQCAIRRLTAFANVAATGVFTHLPYGTFSTALTSPPANGSAVTLANTSSQSVWGAVS